MKCACVVATLLILSPPAASAKDLETTHLFGFTLGNVFAFLMVAFAGTAILYQTSNVLHRFRTDQHVAAALVLFASVALLFWYILRIFFSRR